MTPLDAARACAVRGWPVFPFRWRGPCRKRPPTSNGFLNFSTDPIVITAWWRRWPHALIGVPTGCANGLVVLDVGANVADRNGFDTLAELGARDCSVIVIDTLNQSLAGSKSKDKIAERLR